MDHRSNGHIYPTAELYDMNRAVSLRQPSIFPHRCPTSFAEVRPESAGGGRYIDTTYTADTQMSDGCRSSRSARCVMHGRCA